MQLKQKITTPKVSFKQQLLTIVVVSIILLTLITSTLTAWQSSQTLRKTTINNNVQITHNFADQAVLALLTSSEENAQEAIKQALGFASVISVAIYKFDGTKLISSADLQSPQHNLSTQNLLKKNELLEENDLFWIFSAPVNFSEDLYDDELIDPSEEVTENKVLGHVIIKYNKTTLHEIQRTIFINNLSIGALIAFILAFLISLIINRMIEPLLTLSQTMENARDSKLYSKAPINGTLEIRKIAQIYNQMMSTLEQQKQALEKNHDTLESEIEIRTQELVVARDGALTASRHKSEFLANISHELRTPLQAIIGYTDLVREDLELECMDAQVEDLDKSIRSAHNLLALINNILDLAKIEAGRMDLHLKAVNINSLVHETLDTVRPMASANNNELIVNIGSLTSILMVDRQKLMQIFLNLLSNACKFTKNGKITFEIFNDQSFLYFSVTDTGVGIAKDKLDFIFEQFTQVDGSQTRRFEGTGLGMAITQNFCQLMGATISVESELGKGSVFSVKQALPVDT
jgi:signal transduction histidine kinase